MRENWPFLYKTGVDASADPQGRVAYGLRAFKKALVFVGQGEGIQWDSPVYDEDTATQVKIFQVSVGLPHDGIIGPNTAQALFVKRAYPIAHRAGVNHGMLVQLAAEMSEYDPVARGEGRKEGLLAVDLNFNPQISVYEAWDPEWALTYATKKLAAANEFCGDELGGLAAWDVGRLTAKSWVEAGKPIDGGEALGGQDSFYRATAFVKSVLVR